MDSQHRSSNTDMRRLWSHLGLGDCERHFFLYISLIQTGSSASEVSVRIIIYCCDIISVVLPSR